MEIVISLKKKTPVEKLKKLLGNKIVGVAYSDDTIDIILNDSLTVSEKQKLLAKFPKFEEVNPVGSAGQVMRRPLKNVKTTKTGVFDFSKAPKKRKHKQFEEKASADDVA